MVNTFLGQVTRARPGTSVLFLHQRAYYRVHVHVARQVVSLKEGAVPGLAGPLRFGRAEVDKVDATAKPFDHTGQVVVGTDTKRIGTERDTIRQDIAGVHELIRIRFGADHTGQTRQRTWRIIRVNAQINADFLGHRSYLLDKVIQIRAQFLCIANVLVLIEQTLERIEGKGFVRTGQAQRRVLTCSGVI